MTLHNTIFEDNLQQRAKNSYKKRSFDLLIRSTLVEMCFL